LTFVRLADLARSNRCLVAVQSGGPLMALLHAAGARHREGLMRSMRNLELFILLVSMLIATPSGAQQT